MRWSKYVKPYLRYFILGPLCMVVEVLGEVSMPRLYSRILNVGVETRNVGYIVVTCSLMVLTALLMMGGGLGGAWFGSRAAVNFASDLRRDIYAKVQRFSFANIDKYSTGSLVTRLTNDVTQLQNFVNMLLRMALRVPGMMIGAVIMAIAMNPRLARVLAVTVPLLLIAEVIIIRIAFPRFTAMQQKIDHLNANIQESLTNIRVIKSFVRERHEDEKFARSNDALKTAALRALGVMILAMPLMMLLMNLTSVAVTWFGGQQVIAGQMPVGDFSAFLTYITQILMSLMMMSVIFLNASRAIASANRIREVMEEEIDLTDENAAHADARVTRGEIEFRNVSFRYYKNSENGVLNDVSLKIGAGETVGIIGSTGCGKSTLVSMIPRLYDVDAGAVLVDGIDVRDYSLFHLREGVGMVLQKNVLFSGSIADNLRWGDPEADEAALTEAARSAQADGFIRSFAGGYDYALEQGGVNVSGGQRQRLCIARALLKHPRILILDDSTSAVDTATEAAIRKAFSNELKKSTKIIIAQRITSVMDADKIVVMDDGVVTGVGSHEALLAGNRTYQEIYHSQMDGRGGCLMARSLEALQKQYSSAVSASAGGAPRGPGNRMAATNSFRGRPKHTRDTVARIFGYVGRYWKRLILVALCMLVSTAATLAGSYLLRPIINRIAAADVSAAERVAYLGRMLAVLASVYVAGIAGTYLQSRLMIGVSRTAIQAMRNDLFTRLERLPLRFHDNESTGELMSRFINDVDNIGLMLDQSLMSMFSGFINLVGTLVMMVYTNIWLTLITLVFIPIFIGASRLIISKSRKYYAAQQAALGAANGYIEETVAGQKVVKVFNHEADCEAEFGLLNDDLRGKQMNAMFFGGIMGPITGNLAQVSYALTAGIGGALCALGRFDVGGLAIFVNYSRQFARPINEISQQMATIFSALAGAERVFAIMDMEPEAPDAPDAVHPGVLKGNVVLDDVSFGYEPGKTVLRHISLYARPGQKIAFVGSTGAGKTTITNLLNRFYDIDSGSITVDGIDVRKLPRELLRRNIAMVLQDTHLFTGTIMENIRYGRLDASDEEVIAAAKMASADSFIRRLSNGYDTVIEGDGANLSQGQRQLLNIARAAVSNAPILVLDEATSSVDTRTERLIERGMDHLMKGRTTFVIAHRLSTVRNADAIMVLEHGEIIERGDHDDLLALKGRYYELYTGKSELT